MSLCDRCNSTPGLLQLIFIRGELLEPHFKVYLPPLSDLDIPLSSASFIPTYLDQRLLSSFSSHPTAPSSPPKRDQIRLGHNETSLIEKQNISNAGDSCKPLLCSLGKRGHCRILEDDFPNTVHQQPLENMHEFQTLTS